ncbi:ATP-binding protein [Candidatus Saccharibacteria bacterium]|nr:ATP-binding protein [Candidatus Saccharibacteria bacterium]
MEKVKKMLTQPIGGTGKAQPQKQAAAPVPTVPIATAIVPGQAKTSVSIEEVMNSVADGIVALDRSGTIRLINVAAARLAGFANSADAVGLNYASVLQLVDVAGAPLEERHNPLIKALTNNETMTTRDFSLVSRENQKRTPVELTTSYDKLDDAIIVTYRDISQELKEDGEQMEFISTASHEMRTPIASIEGYLGLALNEKSATIDARAREYLVKAHEASQHLGKLFKDLLDATQASDQRLKASLEPVEMTELVRNVVSGFSPMVAQKNLVLLFNSIPLSQATADHQLTQKLFARVDPGFVREIVNNLMENAIKYTPAGRIEVTVQGSQNEVVVSVRDSGVGISADDLPHIFQKFYRSDNSDTRTINGTGLGLYIARARTEAMDGQLSADSTFGRGSIFFLRLPRMTDEEFDKERGLADNQLEMPSAEERAATVPAVAPAGQTVVQGAPALPAQPAATPAPVQQQVQVAEQPVINQGG